jgi:RING finger protein 165
MGKSGDSDTSQHADNKTSVWAAILCVVVIIIVIAICVVHRSVRGDAIRRSIEAQLPRYNVSPGLGKDIVESMPIVRFNPRLHSQQISAPARVFLPPSDRFRATRPRKHGAQSLPLRKYFTIQNICRESPRSCDAKTQPSDSASTACSICTEDFAEGVKLRLLPCNHLYHPHCIDQWLTNRSRTCPLCRVNLAASSVKKPSPAFIERV